MNKRSHIPDGLAGIRAFSPMHEVDSARDTHASMAPRSRYVQVKLPAEIDEALDSSVAETVAEALVLIQRSGRQDILERADALAEVLAGKLSPSNALVDERALRKETTQRILAHGEWLTAEQIHALQGAPAAAKSQPAADWKRRGRIFGVPVNGRDHFAGYQFDESGQPLPIIRDVLKALGEEADMWAVAAWFHFPNGWLTPKGADAGEAPQPLAPMHALDQREALLHAAEQRLSSYVA